MRAYIGLGANLGDPAAQVREAIGRIAGIAGTRLTSQSPLYKSAPLQGPQVADQPAYCNAVVEVDTVLTAESLLEHLHGIESAMGRERPPERWAPRLIDLDLLLYGDERYAMPQLTLPHPEMHKRNFVMVPLALIAPDLTVPGLGSVADLASELGSTGLARWRA